MNPANNDAHPLEILGHRGAKSSAPENTLASFQTAIDAGVDMIELDVHLSRDNQLLVMHDPQLARTTNGQGLISDYTLNELKTLDAAAKFSGNVDFGVQRIPTLQEVFDRVGEKTSINIEIKTHADGSRYLGIEEQIIALIRQNNAMSTTVVSSFNFPSVQKMLTLEPALNCYVIVANRYFDKMTAEGKGDEQIVADLVQNGFQQVAIYKRFLTKSLMHFLKQSDFKIGAWIINDVDEMLQYAQMGVDRITTDVPSQLVPFKPAAHHRNSAYPRS